VDAKIHYGSTVAFHQISRCSSNSSGSNCACAEETDGSCKSMQPKFALFREREPVEQKFSGGFAPRFFLKNFHWKRSFWFDNIRRECLVFSLALWCWLTFTYLHRRDERVILCQAACHHGKGAYLRMMYAPVVAV